MLGLFSFKSQAQGRKTIGPVWTFNQPNTDVIGIALGISPKEIFRDTTLSRTFGVRVDISPLGLLSPLIPKSPVGSGDPNNPEEIINGLNLSTGSFRINTNGIGIGLMAQYHYRSNGISIAGMQNMAEVQNGISVAPMGNDIDTLRGIAIGFGNSSAQVRGIQLGAFNDITRQGVGIQVGIFNKAKKLRGFQIGLWNKNEKRSLPFINWQFKS